MNGETENARSAAIWYAALAAWAIASLAGILFHPVMSSDSVTRYAPMADAFARGEWALAFHPRFGVLFQALAGCVVAVTGLDGAQALQVVGFGMLAGAMVPVWHLARRIFGTRLAWWAVALLFLGDDLFRYALDGLRDSGKCLAFALLGYGAVERKGAWYGMGLFILITLASYCFAVGTVLWVIWCACALVRRAWRALVWPTIGWAAGTAAVTAMVHAFTGHWLPAPHFIRFLGGWL